MKMRLSPVATKARRLLGLLALLPVVGLQAQGSSPQPAVPIDPVEGIVTALGTHRVVALEEVGGHGTEQGHALLRAWIRDPRLVAALDDIVVEFGSSRYQGIMDRYVAGEDVPRKTLRQVWQNTAVAGTLWDVPIYEEFFRTVREVNATLPKAQALRVLLGDQPIDWDQVHTFEDLRKFGRPDSVPAQIIQREVIAKGRRALVIYGGGHLVRKRLYWNMQDRAEAEKRYAAPVNSIVTHLERAGVEVFSIYAGPTDVAALQSDAARWALPKLVVLKDTVLGAVSYRHFSPYDIYVRRPDNTEERVSSDPNRSPRMQEQFDALLAIGPESSLTYSQLSFELCDDADYMRMRRRRIQIDVGPGGDERLLAYCAKRAPAK